MKNYSLTLEYPDSLLLSLKEERKSFEKKARLIFLAKLYELGKISSGNAAKILNIPRKDFLLSLGEYKVSIFNEDDVIEDLNNA